MEAGLFASEALEELKKKRSGFFQVLDGDSVFASGLTDYVLSLLAGWHGQLEKSPYQEVVNKNHFSPLYREISERQKLIATSLLRIKPLVSDGGIAPVIKRSPEGIRLKGRQTFTADALFAHELLVFIQEEGEAEPSTTVALVPVPSGFRSACRR